jgi:hypothetical protein
LPEFDKNRQINEQQGRVFDKDDLNTKKSWVPILLKAGIK